MSKISISLALKGAAMGVAEVIPGVSGGTIAFITGIYEELIDTVKSFDGHFLGLIKNFKFRSAFEHVNGWFLMNLITGMLFGALVSIFLVTSLLENYPPIVWGFFFGLIISSSLVILLQLKAFNFRLFALVAIGAIVAYLIVTLTPAQGNTSLIYVFFSGMIAICALILPGISGSFILLLLGMYLVIIPGIKEILTAPDGETFLMLAVFAAGCLVGLAIFSRVLSWAFKRFHNEILALLCGFMIGSLWKIWPWRVPTTWMNEATGEILDSSVEDLSSLSSMEEVKILSEQNVMPYMYETGNAFTISTIVATAAGFFLVLVFDRIFAGKSKLIA